MGKLCGKLNSAASSMQHQLIAISVSTDGSNDCGDNSTATQPSSDEVSAYYFGVFTFTNPICRLHVAYYLQAVICVILVIFMPRWPVLCDASTFSLSLYRVVYFCHTACTSVKLYVMSINGAIPADYRASDAIVVPTSNLITRSGGSPTVTGEFTLRDKLPSIGTVSIGIP